MKMITKKFKPGNRESVAQFLFENGIQAIVSYTDSDLFDTWVVVVLACPDDMAALLHLQSFLKNI